MERRNPIYGSVDEQGESNSDSEEVKAASDYRPSMQISDGESESSDSFEQKSAKGTTNEVPSDSERENDSIAISEEEPSMKKAEWNVSEHNEKSTYEVRFKEEEKRKEKKPNYETTEDQVEVRNMFGTKKEITLTEKTQEHNTSHADTFNEESEKVIAEKHNDHSNEDKTPLEKAHEDARGTEGRKKKVSEEKEESKEAKSAARLDSARKGEHKYTQHMLQFFKPYFTGKQIKNESSADINVGYVRLSWLLDISNPVKHTLPACKHCAALLNASSHVDAAGKLWVCEFCGTGNECAEQVPKFGSTLESLSREKAAENEMKIVLCIDISPSMNATIVVGYEKDGDKVKNVRYLTKGTRQKSYVSYWMKVQSAACNLLNNITVDFPSAVVGLVFFSSNLLIYGDTTHEPVDIRDKNVGGRALFMCREKLAEVIRRETKKFMKRPISETRKDLKRIIRSMQPDEGQTALGPTLLAANILLEGYSRGSHVVVLTDGGSNYGFGYLQDGKDENDVDAQFYKDIARDFKRRGVIVSIYTFGSSPCSLSDLAVLSRETQGMMGRHEVPVRTPVVTLPAYVQDISRISILVVANQALHVSSTSDLSSEPAPPYKILNKREVTLLSSIFFFEYKLAPGAHKKPPQSFPIQIQITYRKSNEVLRRTATDYVVMTSAPSKGELDEFDVLIKYGAKNATYALGGATIQESNAIVNVLKNIVEMLKTSKRKNAKSKNCIDKILKQVDAILNKRKDDTKISNMIEEVTADNFNYRM